MGEAAIRTSTAGVDLLAAVTRTATDRGAAHVVVVTAARDDPKRAALDRGGLTPASEWWVTPTRLGNDRQRRRHGQRCCTQSR